MGDNEKSLQGLQGVYILVEDLPGIVEQAGLDSATIRIDVELKLRLAGIKVLTQEETLKQAGAPYLYINVNINKQTLRDIASSEILCELYQTVHLTRDESISLEASTWRVTSVGPVERRNIASYTRDSVKDAVDRFVNAYMSVNPKK